MPVLSSDISAATAAFTHSAISNIQYSGMVGAGGFQAPMADAMAGGMMSRVAGVGMPIASAAAGLLGVDPFSLGARAGMGAFSKLGMSAMGAGAVGMGVMGAAGLGMYAGGALINQGLQGAQQQAQLNQGLRSSFGFQTPYGQGFDRSAMASIGGNIRQMTHEQGIGGQVHTFGELSQLASNMGRMGMGAGVRDAQEFSKKFREMVTTLKSVAQEMGTSLQEAQNFMASQKNSGMFKLTDQAKFATQARQAALGGGLALSEVTAMSSIGSQISRAYGGTGKQGMIGGMRTIGQIGSAQQIGAISEEDIFNATGMTGAEGRQALASRMMDSSGSFLKRGRGRYMLASMAGADGTLDESSVADWMSGEMGVGSTKGNAGRNLSKVGRANFIRNEGRLRGAVLERFGGLTNAMAHDQWLRDRGWDASNMDDRQMIAFQRHTGLGREEADVQMKMLRSLPQLLQQQQTSAYEDNYQQSLGTYKQGKGFEGAKRKYDQMKESVQGRIQEVGQNLYNSLSNQVESQLNKLMGVTERRLSADIGKVANDMLSGTGNASDMVGFKGGTGGGGGVMFGASNASYMELTRLKGVVSGRVNSGEALSGDAADYVKKNKSRLQEIYGIEGVTKSEGLAGRTDALRAALVKGTDEDRAFAKKYLKGEGSIGHSSDEQATMIALMERDIGISSDRRLDKLLGGKLGVGKGAFATVMDGDIAAGKSFYAASGIKGASAADKAKAAALQSGKSLLYGMGASLLMPGGAGLGLGAGSLEAQSDGGADERKYREFGEYMRSESGSKLSRKIASMYDYEGNVVDKAGLSSMADDLASRIATAGETGENIQALIAMRAVALSDTGRSEEARALAKRAGWDTKDVDTGDTVNATLSRVTGSTGRAGRGLSALANRAAVAAGGKKTDTGDAAIRGVKGAIIGQGMNDDLAELQRRTADYFSGVSQNLTGFDPTRVTTGGATGLATYRDGKLTLNEGTFGTKDMQGLVGAHLQSLQAFGSDTGSSAAQLHEQTSQMREAIARMSAPDRKKAIGDLYRGGLNVAGAAAVDSRNAQSLRNRMRTTGRGTRGTNSAFAKELGVEFSAEALAGFDKDPDAFGDVLAREAGLTSSESKEALKKAMTLAKQRTPSALNEAGKLLTDVKSDAGFQKAQLARDKEANPILKVVDQLERMNGTLDTIAGKPDPKVAVNVAVDAAGGVTGAAGGMLGGFFGNAENK